MDQILTNWFPPGVSWALRDPQTHYDLPDVEARFVANAVPKRQRAFSAGRDAARDALAQLGAVGAVLPAGANRAPIWPGGYCGSISHSDLLCIATVVKSSKFSGLGVDLEPAQPLDPALRPSILRDEEQGATDAEALEIFSMKEAVYKAISAQIGVVLEFNQMSVRRSADPTRYFARLCSAVPPFALGHEFKVDLCRLQGHVLSFCAVPNREISQ